MSDVKALAQALMRWQPTKMPAGEDMAFRMAVAETPWFREFEQQYGEAPNLNDPGYDYRGAWRAGVRPELTSDGTHHWPSQSPDGRPLKAPDHPTAWMEPFMSRTGIDPSHYGPQGMAQALMDGFSDPVSGLRLLGVKF